MSLECKILVDKSYYESNLLLQINNFGVATLILNRVAKHNALDSKMITSLNEALDYLSAQNNVKLLILRANGKLFCAGADIHHMQAMVNYNYEENYNDAKILAEVLNKLDNFFCPTLSVVQGAAFGGGVGLVCCTDIVLALDKVEFCLSEVKLGLIPAVISPYILKTMGLKQAKRYMLTAEKFTAEEAYRLGVVSMIAKNDLEDLLNATVTNLLQNSPLAMQSVKKLLDNFPSFIFPSQADINFSVDTIAKLRVSPEGQEGLLAFLEKRIPNWIFREK